MSTVLAKPCRHGHITSKEENEIREIFYQHWEKMKNQMKKSVDKINRWRSQHIQDINLYANEQINILQRDYERQGGIFNKKRAENLDTAKIYHNKKQIDLFNELSAACRTLEFQVAQLMYFRITIERVRVITVEEQTGGMKQNNTNINGLELENDRTRAIIENGNSPVRDGCDIARSSVKSKSSVSNETQEQALTTTSANFDDWSIGNGNNSENHVGNNVDWNDKCPICFMIFPLSMTHGDRHQHVNEHMVDDHPPNEITV